MSPRRSFSWLTALTLQALCVAHGTFGRRDESDFAGPLEEEEALNLNISALNERLAFQPYRASAEARGASNVLFSPLGLGSAVLLLSQVTGPRALEVLGDSPGDAASAVNNLLHNLTFPEGRGGGGPGGAGAGEGGGGSDPGNPLKVWSGLHADGRAPDFPSFLSGTRGSPGFNDVFEVSREDLESSDTLELNTYAYFKGSDEDEVH